jgi:hypothetical protein
MSATYVASSRDTPSLGLDSRPQARRERAAGDQVDPHAQAILEEQLEAHVAIECRGPVEIDEQVQITRLGGVAATPRPAVGAPLFRFVREGPSGGPFRLRTTTNGERGELEPFPLGPLPKELS